MQLRAHPQADVKVLGRHFKHKLGFSVFGSHDVKYHQQCTWYVKKGRMYF